MHQKGGTVTWDYDGTNLNLHVNSLAIRDNCGRFFVMYGEEKAATYSSIEGYDPIFSYTMTLIVRQYLYGIMRSMNAELTRIPLEGNTPINVYYEPAAGETYLVKVRPHLITGWKGNGDKAYANTPEQSLAMTTRNNWGTWIELNESNLWYVMSTSNGGVGGFDSFASNSDPGNVQPKIEGMTYNTKGAF